MQEDIFIAMGANLPHPDYGLPLETLRASLGVLKEKLRPQGGAITACGHWYASKPVYRNAPDAQHGGNGVPKEDYYVNSACRIRVKESMTPLALLDLLMEIEHSFGRIRTVPDAPRTLDLDIIGCGNVRFDSARLTLPHPWLQKRAFVLAPLCDIAPAWCPPGLGNSVRELLAALPAAVRAECLFLTEGTLP